MHIMRTCVFFLLDGEEDTANEFKQIHKLILLRLLRSDRLHIAMANYVNDNLFIDPELLVSITIVNVI